MSDCEERYRRAITRLHAFEVVMNVVAAVAVLAIVVMGFL